MRSTTDRVAGFSETLWDFEYQPSRRELETLYGIAKKNQWNAAEAIDWSTAINTNGPILNAAAAYEGTEFLKSISAEERREFEIRASAWRLSQFLHGEQGALLVCGQLVNCIPNLDAKLYASTQAFDEGRHVEVFDRYIKRLHTVYPVDPLLKNLIDQTLMSEHWELKLVGMQLIIEGIAIGSFHLMRGHTKDPIFRQLLDYVLQDESRHVNFGLLTLKQSIPHMDPALREKIEDFAWTACDAFYGSGNGGFRSIRNVWKEMGWDVERMGDDVRTRSTQERTYVFSQLLIPRLQRIGLISERMVPKYQGSGLL